MNVRELTLIVDVPALNVKLVPIVEKFILDTLTVEPFRFNTNVPPDVVAKVEHEME